MIDEKTYYRIIDLIAEVTKKDSKEFNEAVALLKVKCKVWTLTQLPQEGADSLVRTLEKRVVDSHK